MNRTSWYHLYYLFVNDIREDGIQYLYLYTLGDHVVTSIPIILTVYPFITVLLVFLCYRTYRNKQIV